MNALKSIRKRLGISQEKLAESLGKTKTSVSHYETGRYQLPVDDAKRLVRIAAEYNVLLTLDDVYASADAQPPI